MVAARLPRPGVQVIQEFRATTNTIITPQLVPCIVGVCKQIVELLTTDSSGSSILNSEALIQLPAFFISASATGSTPVFLGLDGLRLSVSINNDPDVTVTFSDSAASGITPATIVSQVNAALTTLGVTSAKAVYLDTERFKFQTVGLGQYQSIQIGTLTDPVVASAFGIGVGQTYYGFSDFNNLETVIPQEAFPDPRSNLDELSFESDSIRVFLSTGSGTGVQEATRTASFLRNGLIDEAATLTSTLQTVPAITYPSSFYGKTLVLTMDGGTAQTFTFPATGFSPATADEVASMLTAGFSGLTVVNAAGVLTWTSASLGASAEIAIGSTSTALTLLGLAGTEDVVGTSIAAVDDGNGDATTSLIEFDGEDFTLAAQNGVLTASTVPDFTGIAAGMTLVLSDGQQAQEVTFTGLETTVVGATNSLKATIEAIVGVAVGGRIAVTAATGKLCLTNTQRFGDESLVKIIGGTVLPYLDKGTTPAITSEGTVSLNADTVAQTVEGTVALSSLLAPESATTMTITVSGGTATTVTLAASYLTVAALLADVNSTIATLGATATQGPGGGMLITTTATGSAATILLAEDTGALLALGLVAGTVAGTDVFPTLGIQTFTVRADENTDTPPTDVQVTLASQTTFADLKVALDGVLTSLGITASQGTNGGLVFTGTTTGITGTIRLVNDLGGGLAILGLSEGISYGDGETLAAGLEARGRVHPPLPGDELYIDGSLYATINKVAPGSYANRLKINTQVTISPNVGARWYIEAKGLTGANSLTRPSADLQVSLTKEAIVKHSIMRDFAGDVVDTRAPLYLTYSAIRLDTTAEAEDPGLLRYDDTTALTDALAPLTVDNPLGLGLYFALVNAPGIQVTGLGVDAVTADMADGTVEAFTRAVEYLEGFEVYAMAPLTHDSSVAQVFNTHVTYMSEPEQRGERIAIWNPATMTRAVDTLVGSGTNGDALTTRTFDTKITNLSGLLQNAGVSPVGTITVASGVFLDIATDDLRYSVKSISGSVVTVRVTAAEFDTGSNDDDYYTESVLPLPLISETFGIRIRGEELVTTTGAIDKTAVSEAVSNLGASFGNRRLWMTFPSKCKATISGTEQLIEGYYMNAATAGAIGQQPPQQSFTNFPITGFTGVVGSNDTFSEYQLDVMAGGGAYIFIQEGADTPIFARMALTTDLTSIETRTDSVNKVVDFTAKFMRSSLRNFIGRFNITQGFLDTLGTTTQGLFGYLVETGVLIGGQLDNIIQDEDNRDTVLIDTTLDVPIPCNYIKLTLVV